MVAAGFIVAWMVLAAGFALGGTILRRAGWDFETRGEHLLFGSGLGLAILSVLTMGIGLLGILHRGVVLVLLAGILTFCGKEIWLAGNAWRRQRSGFRRGRGPGYPGIGVVFLAGWILLNGWISMAPLTGSDAMQYHFLFPKLYSEANGIYPIFWSVLPFLLGLPHMLYLLGMVAVSEPCALFINFLGAALSLFAVVQLGKMLLPRPYALLSGCVYACTPMVYWEATSGLIDLWTVFYSLLSVMAVLRWLEGMGKKWLAAGGIFSGFAAGCKYTLWAHPLFLGLCVLLHLLFRRERWVPSLRSAGSFWAWSLLGGIWPQARNLLWTGDPFYPLFTRILETGSFDPTYLASPARGFSLALGDLILYPARFLLQGERFGGGHFLGPLVLTFLPFLLFAWKEGGHGARLLLGFSACFFGFNAVTSQNPRYLLPVYPVLLLLCFQGIPRIRNWKPAYLGSLGAVAGFLLFGAGSNLVYSRDFVPVLSGQESKEDFLTRKAADYPIAEYLNRVIPEDERALVMLVHPYYLEGDFVTWTHDLSLLIDFSIIDSGEGLRDSLAAMGIRWLIATDRYPEPEETWESLESCCLVEGFRDEITTVQSRRLRKEASLTVVGYRLQGGKRKLLSRGRR